MIGLDRARTAPPLRHAWRQCVCVGRAYELLRADLQAHLRFLQREIGYRHTRFHASFHDDVGVARRGADGRIEYTWTQLDHLYDFLVDAGFDPIFELNPMPAALASGPQTFFWYKMNVTPPREWGEWEALVHATALHLCERYGRDRVRRWYFEVWNEPNLIGSFWTGTQEDYFRLYAAAARGVKRADPGLRVGGPAGAGAAWNLPLAEYCRREGVPLDFVSWHVYPQNEYTSFPRREGSPHAPGAYFGAQLRRAKEELAAAGFGALPILLTEWNTLTCGADGKARWVGNMDVSTLYSAAAACRCAVEADPHADVVAWWAASDVFEEAGPHLEPYGGKNQYYGMLTVDGLPKPAFHAFRFLARMEGPRFEPAFDAAPPAQAGLLAVDAGPATRALLWNHHAPGVPRSDWADTLALPVPAALATAAAVRAVRAHVRAGQGSAYEAWEAMGRPSNLTRIEQDALAAASQPAYSFERLDVRDGAVHVPFRLAPDEVLFVETAAAWPGPAGSTGAADRGAFDRALDVPPAP